MSDKPTPADLKTLTPDDGDRPPPVDAANTGNVNQEAVAELAASLRGIIIQPNDEGYDAARALWNGMIDTRPAWILRCVGDADVWRGVCFARDHGLPVAIRSGGHNIAGKALCEGGLVLDLSGMRAVHVDPDSRRARVQAGATWADLDHETQAHGLAVPGGIVTTTGVAGLTLGGGFGWLTRKHGLTSDNLQAVDLVTADGQRVRASEDEHPELFWGLRGGGGNFGVVTSFDFEAHPVGPTVYGGMILWPMDDAPRVLRAFRDIVAEAPEEAGLAAVLRRAPAAPALPAELHGRPVVGLLLCYAGSLEAGEAQAAALRAIGPARFDALGPKPFSALQGMLDATAPAGRRYYWKSEYLAGLEDAAVETAIGHASTLPSPHSVVLIFGLGGAANRLGPEHSAAGPRDAGFVLNIASSWEAPEEDERQRAWTRSFWEDMRPFSTGGTYVNFLTADEDAQRVRTAYGAAHERLAQLKQRWDPQNRFRFNQNIAPAEAASTAS